MRGLACVGLLLLGCGASSPSGPCTSLSACDCFARKDCNMVKETCWCEAECGNKAVACLECTATKFIRCEDKK